MKSAKKGFGQGFWDWLAGLFGGERAKAEKKYNKMELAFESVRRDNEDELHKLKEEIKALEARALSKKREYEQANGGVQRLIRKEIELIFKEIDGLQGRETIIGANLERCAEALAKAREAAAALKRGVNADQLDDLAIELQELFGELRNTDSASKNLVADTAYAPKGQTLPSETSERLVEDNADKALPDTLLKRYEGLGGKPKRKEKEMVKIAEE